MSETIFMIITESTIKHKMIPDRPQPNKKPSA